MNEMFETNHFRLIKMLHENCVTVGGKTYCPLSQSEISQGLHISRPVVSRMMDELETDGYIIKLSRGKTQLTNKSMSVIEAMKKV